MAPVIMALKAEPWADVRVLATAQHRHMLDQVLNFFGVEPDIDLDIMRPNQALTTLTARLLLDLEDVLQTEQPDAVLAQGDTTTVMTVALACCYARIPFGHVEAGLRTGNISSPFPEEMNRVIVGRLTRWHFAPTESARRNLLLEGVPDCSICVTGNTVIDALQTVAAKRPEIGVALDPSKRLILVTAHRRDNFGAPFREICRAIRAVVDSNEDVQVLYPVHPNPNVYAVAHEMLGGHPRIVLCPPSELSFICRRYAVRVSYPKRLRRRAGGGTTTRHARPCPAA